jgi:hypothetical protein
VAEIDGAGERTRAPECGLIMQAVNPEAPGRVGKTTGPLRNDGHLYDREDTIRGSPAFSRQRTGDAVSVGRDERKGANRCKRIEIDVVYERCREAAQMGRLSRSSQDILQDWGRARNAFDGFQGPFER